MISPINNNIPSEYQTPKKVSAADTGSEHFSLKSALEHNEDHEGVIYEPSEESNTPKETSGGKTGGFADTLANVPQREYSKEEPDRISETANQIWKGIQDFFVSLWNNIRKIFGNLWDSKPISEGLEDMSINLTPGKKDQAAKSNVANPSAESFEADGASVSLSTVDSLESSRDEKIKKALKDQDRDLFRALISEGGAKTPARSTDMLTTYTAKGTLKEIDPSDQNKILHGDRGTRKL
jgi:hypothetical protein